MNKLAKIYLSLSLIVLSSCTEPGETTYISTATGGVLGAGLGAIIGNQTGDAGAGLAIGGLAGAGAGAAIGNALEAQQKSIRSQDEALERQQKILAAQNAEIQELRGAPIDAAPTKSFSSEARGSLARGASITDQLNSGGDLNSQPAQYSGKASDSVQGSNSKIDLNAVVRDRSVSVDQKVAYSEQSPSSLVETDLKSEQTSLETANLERANLDKADAQKEASVEQDQSIAKALAPVESSLQTAECSKAQAEVQKADSAKEGADKLFYLRRAIRLCPSSASYHKSLADQYLSLGRNEDAKAAYEDAVRLDPAMTEAKEALSAISSGNIY